MQCAGGYEVHLTLRAHAAFVGPNRKNSTFDCTRKGPMQACGVHNMRDGTATTKLKGYLDETQGWYFGVTRTLGDIRPSRRSTGGV
eukprot:646668-Pyramimonas_sp.AAC.1